MVPSNCRRFRNALLIHSVFVSLTLVSGCVKPGTRVIEKPSSLESADQKSGSNLGDGLSSLVVTKVIDKSSPVCPDVGGTEVQAGLDKDRNGTLEAMEVMFSGSVCNGKTGTSPLVKAAFDKSLCDNRGGLSIKLGSDDATPSGTAANGILEDAEVDFNSPVCNGTNIGIRVSEAFAFDPTENPNPDCPSGGLAIETWLDGGTDGRANNGKFESVFGEAIIDRAFVCNSSVSLVKQTAFPPSSAVPSCQKTGGIRIESGSDNGDGGGIAGNNVLDTGEIDSTSYVCNGADSKCANNKAPTISSIQYSTGAPFVEPNTSFSATIVASDPDGDPLTFSIAGSGASYSQTGNVFNFVAPASGGPWNFSALVSDSCFLTTKSFGFRAQSVTKIPLLVLLVSFADVAIVNTNSSTWNQRFFDGTTVGTVNNYYRWQSAGSKQFSPASETRGVNDDGVIDVTLGTNHPNTGNVFNAALNNTIISALTAADPNINFANFDANGNGKVTADELSVLLIFAGGEAATAQSNRTYPAVWGVRLGGLSVTLDGVVVGAKISQAPPRIDTGGVTVFGERQFYSNPASLSAPDIIAASREATVGIMAHELGHLTFGAPDLYASAGRADLGSFDLMAGGSWGAKPGEGSGQRPVHMSSWTKELVGFTKPITLKEKSESVGMSGTNSFNYSARRIDIASVNQYFLVENRSLDGYDAGIDHGLVDTYKGGVLVLHYDSGLKKLSIRPAVISTSFNSSEVLFFKENAANTDNSWGLEANPFGSQLSDGKSSGIIIDDFSPVAEDSHFRVKQ